MSVVVTYRPDRTHVENSALISRWICARQPIIFGMVRRDYSVNSIINTGGLVELMIPVTTEFVVGNVIYFENSFYNKVGNITAVTPSGAFTRLLTDIVFVSSSGAGYINNLSREGYRIEITVYLTNSTTNAVIQIPCRITPFIDGTAKAYLQSLVTGYLLKQFDFFYNSQNQKDPNSYSKFYFTYQAKWQGGEDGVVTDPYTYYSIDAVKQLIDDYGQNMLDYLLMTASTTKKAKFLTQFPSPTWFTGYPISWSFLYPQELESSSMTIEQEDFNNSNASLGTTNAAINYSQAGGVNHLIPIVDGNDPAAKSFDVWLKVGGIAQRSYYKGGYIASGYFELVPPSPGGTVYQVTEKLRVKIKTSCCDRPMYLRWRNSLGGWDYWLFECNQVTDDTSKTLGTFASEPDEISTGMNRDKVTQMERSVRITVGDYVSKDDFTGINGLRDSPEVQWLYNREVYDKWMSVQIVAGTFKYRNEARKIEVKMQIDLPSKYTVPN